MKDSQRDLILRHLQQGHSITPLTALQEFGCLRLSGRILELRQAGHDIRSDMVTVRGRKGGKCRVASYRLVDAEQADLFGWG